MALTQAQLDRVASHTMAMYGALTEDVTWDHKATATSAVVTSTVTIQLHGYRSSEIDNETILRTDLRGRIAGPEVSFTLTQYDEFVRSDGTRWRVLQPNGGPGHAFWRPQCRQVA